jgi:hypothetical protein
MQASEVFSKFPSILTAPVPDHSKPEISFSKFCLPLSIPLTEKVIVHGFPESHPSLTALNSMFPFTVTVTPAGMIMVALPSAFISRLPFIEIPLIYNFLFKVIHD